MNIIATKKSLNNKVKESNKKSERMWDVGFNSQIKSKVTLDAKHKIPSKIFTNYSKVKQNENFERSEELDEDEVYDEMFDH